MLFNKKRIYLDYASATPILPIGASTVAAVSKMFGNPGGMHREAVQAKAQLGKARASIASAIGCTANRIVLTSGGTEGNNIAVLGVAQHIIRTSGDLSKTHWIASAIEHDSILNVFSEVERLGGKVSYVEPNQNGIIEPSALALTLRPETVFVSIGWANSEIGVVQPISRLAKVIREHETISKTRVYLHADAGQAPVYEKTTVHSLGVDILTLDSGKLYGPRGIGALYVKPDVFMSSIIFGGKQELGLRPGTENVALAAGFAASFAQVVQEREQKQNGFAC
jgi:cysteine desulfurase